MSKRPEVSYAPGSDWFMLRGKKVMAATTTHGRVSIGVWKELPRARGAIKEWRDGQEMRLTPEEALDLAYALGFMAHELDPETKKKHTRWVARGRHRVPVLRLIRGGVDGVRK